MKIIIFFVSVLLLVLIGFYLNQANILGSIKSPSGADEPKENSFTLITTGDIGLGRYVNYMIVEKNDPNFPFYNIADYLKSADLTIINLENPLITSCPTIVTGFKFCGDSKNADGLVFAGVDAVNLANNHTTNYGLSGLIETKSTLEEKGIAGFGLNEEIEYIETKGHKVSLVGFVELGNNWSGLSNATETNIKTLVSKAYENSDIVIASFHWGNEYTHVPSSNQVLLAKLAIDSGADIVLGNHAHWIQPIEKYKDKYIVYAQGNTVFDQDWSQKTREGVIYKFEFQEENFNLVEEKYTIIDFNSQPRFADENESSRIISYF